MISGAEAGLDPQAIPYHVAIIPDGNRRFAKSVSLDTAEGHKTGANVVTDVIIAAKNFGVKVITFFAFSTENWKRAPWEVATLIYLMDEKLKRDLPRLKEEGVVLHTIGELSAFPESFQETIAYVKEETKGGTGIDFILALNYGGRDELRRTLSKIVDRVVDGTLSKEDLSEELIGQYLDTGPFGDPDLIIRTSGEMRTSNFLLWQNSYSEWVIIDKFWPTFKPEDLLDALFQYQKRDRRRGGGA